MIFKENDFQKYGNFSQDGRTFVITDPRTPRPWINYSWSDHFYIALDQRAQGAAVYKDTDGNLSIAVRDRILMFRDNATGKAWSVTWGKKTNPDAACSVICGLGYSTYVYADPTLEIRWTVTASPQAQECWQVQIRNLTAARRSLSLYAGVEFNLGGWEPYGSLENYFHTRKISDRLIYSEDTWVDQARQGVRNNAYFMADRPASSTECSRQRFLGDCYADYAHAAALSQPELSNGDAMNELELGLMQFNLSLDSQAEDVFYFQLASVFTQDDAEEAMQHSLKENFLAGMQQAEDRTRLFNRVDIDWGLPLLNHFLNIWAKQQLLFLRDFARIFLTGFRDSLQDAASIVTYAPEQAGRSILNSMRYERQDGSALRGWCPLDEHKYADSGVWLPMAVAEYLRETGDFSFLQRTQRYYDSDQEETVWEHIRKVLAWFKANLGVHGLPRIYFGDWNDSLNIGRGGEGESVWLAMALVVALQDSVEIAARAGLDSDRKEFQEFADSLRRTIEEKCWDGEWYLRGFDDRHEKVGSHENGFGKIFSEPQSWAAMAGLRPDRVAQAAASVEKYLRTPNGLTVCDPPYTRYTPSVGRISCMLPGWGENASCYCHVTAFQMVADCLAKDGDLAFRDLLSILPFHSGLSTDISKLEPYAFTNMFRGPGNLRPGETFKGWTSGTVPWAVRGISHFLMGIRPDYDGLIIDPVPLSQFARLTVKRTFQDHQISLTILNPRHLTAENSVPVLKVNGRIWSGKRIGLSDFSDGTTEISCEFCTK